MGHFSHLYEDDADYIQEQEDGHRKIEERRQGCYYCRHFNGCHTAVWRKGQTCDLFLGK